MVESGSGGQLRLPVHTVDMRPAIDEEGVAGDIAAIIAAEKDSHRADVLQRVADAPHWIGPRDGRSVLRTGSGEAAVGLAGSTGTDDVAADLVAGPFPRGGTGEAAQRFLGGVVVGAVHVRVDTIERTEVDHPPAAEPAEFRQ